MSGFVEELSEICEGRLPGVDAAWFEISAFELFVATPNVCLNQEAEDFFLWTVMEMKLWLVNAVFGSEIFHGLAGRRVDDMSIDLLPSLGVTYESGQRHRTRKILRLRGRRRTFVCGLLGVLSDSAGLVCRMFAAVFLMHLPLFALAFPSAVEDAMTLGAFLERF